MKALVYHGKGDLQVGEVADPTCDEGQAIIEVKNAGICGSDLTVYAGKHSRVKPPVILGHEFSGVIAERRGNRRPDLKVGDPVVVEPTFSCGACDLCRSGSYHICKAKGLYGIDADGAFAPFVRVSLERILKLPGVVSFEEGAMVEPLAVAVRAIGISRLSVGEIVTVVGAGPIGLLTAQVSRAAGASHILVVEPIEFRRNMAERLGFSSFAPEQTNLENILKATGGREIDVVFDAAASPAAALLGTQLVRRAGRIVIVSIYKEPVPYDLAMLTYGEIQVMGSCIYTYKDFGKALSLLNSRKVDLLPLVTHRFPLEKGVEAFETLRRGENVQKVLLEIS